MTKILVVDDIDANRILLSKMLRMISGEDSYEIFQAGSGDEAVKQYKENRPDLILMDYNMPHKTGCETAREIKALDGDDYTPIIFVTAMNASSVLQDALSSGGDDYIGKPFDIGVLKSKINAHLRIRDLTSKLKEKNEYLTREQELIEHFFENTLNKSFLDKRYISYHMSSISAFNGDLFLVRKGPNGGLYVLVGDFTGHGLSAAMGTLPVAIVFFKMTAMGFSLVEIVKELNFHLHALMPTSMFFAAALMYLDATGTKLSVWMGGMPDSYWMGSNGEIKACLHSKYMPLGILDSDEFEAETEDFDVTKGDKIYIFSDGVTETMNPQGEVMFTRQIEDVLVKSSGNRIENVLAELRKFSGSDELTDDITLVELTCDETREDSKGRQDV